MSDRPPEYATAYDHYPTALCTCGVSFHDAPGNRVAHETEYHSAESPASYRLFDQREDPAREIAFWEDFYAEPGRGV